MLYRKAWRLGYILPNRLDNMQHSFYVTVHFSVTAFDLESFLPSLWVDSIYDFNEKIRKRLKCLNDYRVYSASNADEN